MKPRDAKRRGHAALELALVLPLLPFMAVGTIDLGRIFFNGIAAVNASHAGAFFGSQGNIEAVNTGGINSSADDSASDLDSVTSSSTHYCDCPDSPAAGPGDRSNVVVCAGKSCPNGYGVTRVFVRSRIVHTFNTIAPYPGIPNQPTISQNGFMRMQ